MPKETASHRQDGPLGDPFLNLVRKAYRAIYSQQKHLDENEGQLGHSRTALEALREAFALIGATL